MKSGHTEIRHMFQPLRIGHCNPAENGRRKQGCLLGLWHQLYDGLLHCLAHPREPLNPASCPTISPDRSMQIWSSYAWEVANGVVDGQVLVQRPRVHPKAGINPVSLLVVVPCIRIMEVQVRQFGQDDVVMSKPLTHTWWGPVRSRGEG